MAMKPASSKCKFQGGVLTGGGLIVYPFIIIFDQKHNRMKKYIAKALFLSAIIGFSVSSCELLGDCKTCSKVTTINGVETNRTVGVLYCGDNLADIEAESAVKIGSETKYWDCN